MPRRPSKRPGSSRQRDRVAPEPWRVYHDRTSDPDTLSVEAVGRGNLLALTHLGYDGPSAREIREAAESGHPPDAAACRIPPARFPPTGAPTITCGWTSATNSPSR